MVHAQRDASPSASSAHTDTSSAAHLIHAERESLGSHRMAGPMYTWDKVWEQTFYSCAQVASEKIQRRAHAAAIVFVESQGAREATQACGGERSQARTERVVVRQASVVAASAAEPHAWRANFAPRHAKQEVAQQLRVSHPIRPRRGVGGQLTAPQIACHLHVMLMVQFQAAQCGAR